MASRSHTRLISAAKPSHDDDNELKWNGKKLVANDCMLYGPISRRVDMPPIGSSQGAGAHLSEAPLARIMMAMASPPDTLFRVQSESADSSRQRFWGLRFERVVVLITTLVWLGHFILNSVLIAITGSSPNDLEASLSRLATYLLAIASCWLLHLVLRPYRSASVRFTLLVLALSVPVGMLVGWLGYVLFTHYGGQAYEEKLTLWKVAVNYVRYLQWLYFTWAALYAATCYVFAMQDNERRLAAAENAATQAQLLALRLQISPHFLFNTLDAVAALVALDRRLEAEAMLVHLSRFLRHTLSTSSAQTVPLENELDLVGQYLAIERVRFSDRLRIEYSIEQASRLVKVPRLLLLPLVENAIKHGFGHAEGGMILQIGADLDDAHLRIWVDNSVSANPRARPGLGIGLQNVRERLEALYGPHASLTAGPMHAGWRSLVRVSLRASR